MATKKQKREAGLQRHKEFLAEVRRSGLEAQKRDREQRDKKHRADWAERHESHSWKKLSPDCPLCQDMLAKSKRDHRIKIANLKKAAQSST